MLSSRQLAPLAALFKMIGDPIRIRLLLALAEQEACVCHLERLLGKRQAYISQHLMSLREAGLLSARRSGKYIFYHLKDRNLLNLIHRAVEISGAEIDSNKLVQTDALVNCECPTCTPSKLITIQ
jgi:ArsR family transcriptional regulator